MYVYFNFYLLPSKEIPLVSLTFFEHPWPVIQFLHNLFNIFIDHMVIYQLCIIIIITYYSDG